MENLKLTLLPITIGIILLFTSWVLSYPVSIDSQNDFIFNHFSYLYWASLALLFVSFFVVAVKTKNGTVRWAVTACTAMLIFSQSYFYYLIPGTDANQFRGLTEYFISNGLPNNLSLYNHYYFSWPLFFTINKIAVSTLWIDLRVFQFLMYASLNFILASLLYLNVSRVQKNAYPAVISFFIMLIPLSELEFFTPFALCLCLFLLLVYLDNLSKNLTVQLAIIAVFVAMAYTHILVPIFFIIYCLFMFFLKKNRKYLYLFIVTTIIYVLVVSQNVLLVDYLKQFTSLSFLTIGNSVGTIAPINSVALKPFIGLVAQLFSRISVITTAIISFLGFIILFRRRKLGGAEYALLLTGVLFLIGLLVAPNNYDELSSRAYFLILIPVSLGASYLCDSKLKKYIMPVFLVLLILFTFTLMAQTFYDKEIFFQTKAEYQSENFLITNVNSTIPTSVFSTYRVGQYLMSKSTSPNIKFGDELYKEEFPINITNYNYIVYNIGLAKSFLAINCSTDEAFGEFDANQYFLIYNSGSDCIFLK
jgi:hypothetical protein